MGFNSKNNHKRTDTSLSLEALIKAIDRQVDQVPHPYAAEGFAAYLDSGTEEHKNKGQQYIRFLLNKTAFALPLPNATEIDYLPEVTPLPNLPQWVLGICNLRGDIVSVVDLKQILHLESGGAGTAKKLILIRNDNISTAIIVDKVMGILSIGDQHNQIDSDLMENKVFSKFIQKVIGLGRQTVHLLDVDVLMTAIEI